MADRILLRGLFDESVRAQPHVRISRVHRTERQGARVEAAGAELILERAP